ncbi:hypothetical protein EDB80DRAFT_821479 [Ilyonectria destructans]|nr:hypothetical protein EDB80DRAFT_821479 [Ilyonectria destructans]
MHFKSPLSTEENCKLMPDIPGLQDPEKCLKTGLKILGVEVDHRLRWDNHLEHIKAKVEKQMRYFQRISGSIWGLSLAAARRVYLAKIRPIISYACGVWFIHSSVKNTTLRWRLSKKNMKLLDDLQSACLKKMSGALGRCSPRVLEKELNIENIHVFLSRAAMSDRAKTMGVTSSYPYVNGAHVERKQYAPQTSPYQVLNGETKELCVRARRLLEENCKKQSSGDENVWLSKWLDPQTRKKAIGTCAKQEGIERSARLWDKYRKDRERVRRRLHRPAVLAEDWGAESFQYYKGLTRAQSTMLLHCRTEFIGLNGYLFNAKQVPSAACPCGHPQQTVFHMFVHCRNLDAARARLTAELEHNDMKRLMTENGAVVADWGITFFNIDQFLWPRQDSQFNSERPDTH